MEWGPLKDFRLLMTSVRFRIELQQVVLIQTRFFFNSRFPTVTCSECIL